MAKKENKMKKYAENRRAEVKERDERFKKNGFISLGIIAGCAAVLYVLSVKIPGTKAAQVLSILLMIVMGIAFIWSVINAAVRMKQLKQEEEEERRPRR